MNSMTSRFGVGVLAVACAGLLFACPPTPTPDGGTPDSGGTGGSPAPLDACSGGCSANQICDTEKHVCKDACGGCDGGTCVRLSANTFTCRPYATTCGSTTCAAGQVACLGGNCSCLSSTQAGQDTCNATGQWCGASGACSNPGRYDECEPGGPSCPMGHTCNEQLFSTIAFCNKNCQAAQDCDRGEFCSRIGCLPDGLLFSDCHQHIPVPADAGITDGGLLEDGGFVPGAAPFIITKINDAGQPEYKLAAVPISNTCLLKDSSGRVTDPAGVGTGRCEWTFVRTFSNGNIPFDSCRPPGTAQLGQECRDDNSFGATATQCATGLHCAIVRGANRGVCMRSCNANPARPGFDPKPSCGSDEACVNLYRYTDPNDNAVQGVCMKRCSVFDPLNATCSNFGTVPTSCVPAPPSGDFIVSTNGNGICMPQQVSIAAAGAACSERDSFKGAACGSAQVCIAPGGGDNTICVQVCDTSCNPPDGGTAPARCMTEPNARCPTGKSCVKRTSTTGATLGFCE